LNERAWEDAAGLEDNLVPRAFRLGWRRLNIHRTKLRVLIIDSGINIFYMTETKIALAESWAGLFKVGF